MLLRTDGQILAAQYDHTENRSHVSSSEGNWKSFTLTNVRMAGEWELCILDRPNRGDWISKRPASGETWRDEIAPNFRVTQTRRGAALLGVLQQHLHSTEQSLCLTPAVHGATDVRRSRSAPDETSCPSSRLGRGSLLLTPVFQ